MAQQGFYADPPSRRMAYDADGSVTFYVNPSNVVEVQTATFARSLNSEATAQTYDGDRVGTDGRYFGVIFPEIRDVTHTYRSAGTGSFQVSSFNVTMEVSPNTTNGLDGDWVSAGTFLCNIESTNPNFRTRLGTLSGAGAKGVRHNIPESSPFSSYSFRQWHLHGYKAPGQTPHRIDFCDSTGAEFNIDNDFGDQPRNSSRTWSPATTFNQGSGLYLKNRSSTKQANDIALTFETVNSVTDFPQHVSLSLDNVTFGPILNISQINPQQIVGPIYVRSNPSITAALGLKTGRIKLNVGEWL